MNNSIIVNSGPWQVDVWSNNQIVIQAHHGDEDLALIVNGNFASHESKLEYANKFCAELNKIK